MPSIALSPSFGSNLSSRTIFGGVSTDTSVSPVFSTFADISGLFGLWVSDLSSVSGFSSSGPGITGVGVSDLGVWGRGDTASSSAAVCVSDLSVVFGISGEPGRSPVNYFVQHRNNPARNVSSITAFDALDSHGRGGEMRGDSRHIR